MIKEDFCSPEVAKLLNKKGFDEEISTYYLIHSNGFPEFFHKKDEFPDPEDVWLKCPTHQMGMKWLREVHNICITIYPDKEKGYEAVLYDIKNDVEIILQSFGVYGSHIFEKSFEEAVEAALKYVLENLI